MAWNFTNKAATETEPESVDLRIDGEIIDDAWVWLYEWYEIPATSPNAFRNELKKYDGKSITVWIDSYGGSVFAASGIYTALKEHKGGVKVKIDGRALSAASVIAMAGDEVLMSPTAMMMIHNPLTVAEGDMHEMRKTAEVLDEVKETIINAYQLKTGKSRKKLSEMMDNETWMGAKLAQKEGFSDGMLFEGNAEPEVTNMVPVTFNRLAIQNGVKESLKKLMELQQSQAATLPEPDKPDPTDLAKAKLILQMSL